VKWLDRLLISLNLRKPQPQPRRQAAIEPRGGWPRPAPRDDDTQPFVRRGAVLVPLSELPPLPGRAHHLHVVPGGRVDNAMGDPWVPPGAYGAAASLVENGEPPASMFMAAGGGGEFSGGGADVSWKTDGGSGCSSSDSGGDSGGDSGSSGGCGGSD
jgi:hypothetical protein